MIIKHKDLVKKGKKILKEKGFKRNQIFEEYSIRVSKGKKIVVDLVGMNDERSVAIECGGLQHKDLSIHKEYFDECILLPYVTQHSGTFHCSNCDHNWRARVEVPKQCPKCKRYFALFEKGEVRR